MGRYKEAPFGFECEYKNKCPHLGMSTTWAKLLIADFDKDAFRLGHMEAVYKAEIKALEQEIGSLRKKNAELEARLKLEHSSKFKPNKQKTKQWQGDWPATSTAWCAHRASALDAHDA